MQDYDTTATLHTPHSTATAPAKIPEAEFGIVYLETEVYFVFARPKA